MNTPPEFAVDPLDSEISKITLFVGRILVELKSKTMRATVRLQLRKDYVREDGKLQLVLRYLAHQKSSYIGLGIMDIRE